MEPLRFGIVGCGVISGTHGNALRKLEDEGLARLVAAADVDKGRAEKFAASTAASPADRWMSCWRGTMWMS